MHAASTTSLQAGIVAIDTEYARPLQDASHLIIENGRAAFVDTGANSSVPLLLDALRQASIPTDAVDYVFLTHVHLDHAGGAGLLMQQLPNARCVLHPRGAPHMVDPTRLIAGTIAVYGEEQTHAIYGDIQPIAESRIDVADDGQVFELQDRPLRAIFTEGHARHHYVLHDPQSRGVFTGDSFGVSYRETDTAKGAIAFPTTTPIDFDPDEAHRSIDKILACEPEQVYLTHYSRVDDVQRIAAELHQSIDDYVTIALDNEQAEERQPKIASDLFAYMCERLSAHGFSADRDTLWSILHIDVDLNSQGLDVWLNRRHKLKR